jgi:hypothetical protein
LRRVHRPRGRNDANECLAKRRCGIWSSQLCPYVRPPPLNAKLAVTQAELGQLLSGPCRAMYA